MNCSNYYGVEIELYTVIHHQYYQMVDLLIQYCRQSIGRSNQYALPYVIAKYHKEVKISRKLEKKDW